MTLTDWCEIINIIDKSIPKSKVRKIIINNCLSSDKKLLNAYQINQDLVWQEVVATNPHLLEKMKSENINNRFQLESYYEQIKYHSFGQLTRVLIQKASLNNR